MAEEPFESKKEEQREPEPVWPPDPGQTGEMIAPGEKTVPPIETNPEQNKPNMEVHKHPHHPMHKKKLGEYLLEFLMLFLAVFLGFIAENIREHYVERHRAKEYAQSLYNDLKKDSADLKRAIGFKQWQNKNLDSLVISMSDPNFLKHTRELYYYSCFANLPNLFFSPSDITVQQLRNSGSLRYFTNVELYNTLSRYYGGCAIYLGRENDITQLIPPLALVSKIFSADQLRFMYNDKTPPADIKQAIHWPADNQDFKLLETYKDAWNEYSLFVQRLRRRNGLPIGLLMLIEKDQRELMTDLKKEYDVN